MLIKCANVSDYSEVKIPTLHPVSSCVGLFSVCSYYNGFFCIPYSNLIAACIRKTNGNMRIILLELHKLLAECVAMISILAYVICISLLMVAVIVVVFLFKSKSNE